MNIFNLEIKIEKIPQALKNMKIFWKIVIFIALGLIIVYLSIIHPYISNYYAKKGIIKAEGQKKEKNKIIDFAVELTAIFDADNIKFLKTSIIPGKS